MAEPFGGVSRQDGVAMFGSHASPPQIALMVPLGQDDAVNVAFGCG